MRELISILESMLLNEASRGLFFRANGDRFFKGKKDKPERVLIFNGAEYFPSLPGEYKTHEEMIKAYQSLGKKYPGMVPVNAPTEKHKAFAVLTLTDEATKKPYYSVRFFNTIKPNMAGAWKNNELTQNKGEYQLEKETSLKSTYKLKPSDIFSPPARFKNVRELLKAFEASPTAQPFVPGFKMLYQAKPQLPEFENSEEYFSAIRDDLGEIIGPVALIQGLDVGDGAAAAKKDLLGGKGWAGSGVFFPAGKTNNLLDSYIKTPSGVEVGLSSKGEKGATASIKNVSDGIQFIKSQGSDEQKKLLKKYDKEVKLIKDMSSLSAIDFPIKYGVIEGLISQETGEAIKRLISSGAKTISGLNPRVTQELKKLMSQRGALVDKENYNVGYHALAALATIEANLINEDPKFGKACLAFLNASPIIQLHMHATTGAGGTVKVTGFSSTYPPNFKGTVGVDSDKNYSATGVSGRLTFSYVTDKLPTPAKPVQVEIPFAKAAEKVATGRALRKKETKKPEKGIRAKRK